MNQIGGDNSEVHGCSEVPESVNSMKTYQEAVGMASSPVSFT